MGNSSSKKEHNVHNMKSRPEELPAKIQTRENNSFNVYPILYSRTVSVNNPSGYNHESNRSAASAPHTCNSSSRKEYNVHNMKSQPEELPAKIQTKENNSFNVYPILYSRTVSVNNPSGYNHESNRSAASAPHTYDNLVLSSPQPGLVTKAYFNKEERNNENQMIYMKSNISANAVPPSKIVTKDDFMATWFSWKNEFLTYMKLIDQKESNKQKWGIMLLNRMGPIGQEIHRTFTFNKDHAEEDIDTLLKKFDFYCIFGGRRRGDDEEIDKYVNNLMVMALKHETDINKVLKEKILMEIDKEKFARKAESLIAGFSFLSSIGSLTIKEITFIWMSYENANFKRNEVIVNDLVRNCNNCGRTHRINNCPAHGKQCNKCGNENHYGMRCPSQCISCSYCGETHFMRECPAYTNECNKCHRLNHFSWKCTVPRKLNCNFCGLTHIRSRSACSAINTICTNCHKRGHVAGKCNWRK